MLAAELLQSRWRAGLLRLHLGGRLNHNRFGGDRCRSRFLDAQLGRSEGLQHFTTLECKVRLELKGGVLSDRARIASE